MPEWTKQKELDLINSLQDEYINELIDKIDSQELHDKAMKYINFTSPTGTGKTIMMCKLVQKRPNDFFIITSLSRGHLYKQIESSIYARCNSRNVRVYGASSFTKVSHLSDDNILHDITSFMQQCPDAHLYWLRDEGHIATNNWTQLLEDRCDKIINFSATNKEVGGIVCNFTNTMMLRTVLQQSGDIDAALDQLATVKKSHKMVKGYNPCAIFRLVTSQYEDTIIQKAKKYHYKCITLIDNNDYNMEALCQDDNEYDIIINKQKIVEGIDIRRAHVIWMENQPSNPATTIQLIGRCRRNALLWRTDIDILAPDNAPLLKNTRICYAFYNVKDMRIDYDENGELAIAFCPYISVEALKPNSKIYVENGAMPNGLQVIELTNRTGYFTVLQDSRTGFHYVSNPTCYKNMMSDNIDPILQDALRFNKYLQTRNNEYFDNIQNVVEAIQNNQLYSAQYRHEHEQIHCTIYNNPIFAIDTNGNLIAKTINEGAWGIPKHMIIPSRLMASVLLTYRPDDDTEPIVVSKRCNPTRFRVHINNSRYFECSLAELQQIASQHIYIPQSFDTNMHNTMLPYSVTYNNRVLALMGHDTFVLSHGILGQNIWRENKSITSKLSINSKLRAYMKNTFQSELRNISPQLFYNQPMDFGWDRRKNTCFGFCVEYYAKYILFGPHFLGSVKTHVNEQSDDATIIKAIIEKYHQMMQQTYQRRWLTGLSLDTLKSDAAKSFIAKVKELGIRTAQYVSSYINIERAQCIDHRLLFDCFTGLIDLMDDETIIDIKCTNAITEQMALQVLSYYWLSQFRSDLHIKRVIIYDAISQRNVTIELPVQNSVVCSTTVQKAYDIYNAMKTKTLATAESPSPLPSLPFSEICNHCYTETQKEQIAAAMSQVYRESLGHIFINTLALTKTQIDWMRIIIASLHNVNPDTISSADAIAAFCQNPNDFFAISVQCIDDVYPKFAIHLWDCECYIPNSEQSDYVVQYDKPLNTDNQYHNIIQDLASLYSCSLRDLKWHFEYSDRPIIKDVFATK